MSHRDVRIRPASVADHAVVLDILATAMADNPLHAAAYGDDVGRRIKAHRRLVRAAFEVLDGVDLLCAEADGRVVGAAGMTRVGGCRPTTRQRLALMPTLTALGPRVGRRVARWLAAWAEHDPDLPHVHVGPVAVATEHQGRGWGSHLMRAVVDRLDTAEAAGYLETDRDRNIAFYERLGFDVVGRGEVLGVPNWFMWRDPALLAPRAEAAPS